MKPERSEEQEGSKAVPSPWRESTFNKSVAMEQASAIEFRAILLDCGSPLPLLIRNPIGRKAAEDSQNLPDSQCD
jgi:hypothetical protein